jgi:hypothetical protein
MSGWEAQELSSGSATTRASASSRRTSLARTDKRGDSAGRHADRRHRNDITQSAAAPGRRRPARGQGRTAAQATQSRDPDRGYDHDKYRRDVAARRQADDRPAPDRARLRARPPALGRRAHLRLAAPLPTPAGPLGTRPRTPPRLHAPRLRRHPLAAPTRRRPRSGPEPSPPGRHKRSQI